jgi:hypothetical protein
MAVSEEQEDAIDADHQEAAVFTETEHEDLSIEAEVEVMEVEVAQAEELPEADGEHHRNRLPRMWSTMMLPCHQKSIDSRGAGRRHHGGRRRGFPESYRQMDSQILVLTEPFIDEWILEAPGQSLPEISLSDELDAGLASADISWLMPFVADFDLPIPAMITGRKAAREAIAEVAEISELSVEVLEPSKEEMQEETVVIKEDAPNEDPTLSPPITSDVKDEQPENIVAPKAPAFSSTHSFDEWLQILSKQKEAGGEEPAFEMPQPDYIGTAEVDDRDKPEAKELVDVPESDVKRWAQESVTMQKDMASETLAKIYLQQGKQTLAIQIYKKLMERFPEKSTYFAAQIKSIKQE